MADQDLVVSKAQELMNRSALDRPGDPLPQQVKDLNSVTNAVDNLDQGLVNTSPVAAKRKVFNLKKHAQMMGGPAPATGGAMDPFGAEVSPGGLSQEQDYINANPAEQSVFNSHAELNQELSNYPDLESFQSAHQDIANAISDNQNAVGALDRYYQESNDEIRAQLAEIIYKGLPPNMRNQQEDWTPQDGMTIPVEQKRLGSMYSDFLNRITASIKEAADKAGSAKRAKTSNVFNLKKIAQHQTGSNVIMWGPGQTRIDPFYRQPVSDWHIMERNKGFGGDIDGYWGVDWEAFWRGNVMDKYSRPYRDTETGEWVGGYIQKRFEVDKWIPEANNMQLLPGERRKPILPEYGSTEARLQAMRNKNDGHLGREFNDTSKPFNWREAKAAGKLQKTASPYILKAKAQSIVDKMSSDEARTYMSYYDSGNWEKVAEYVRGIDMPQKERRIIADNIQFCILQGDVFFKSAQVQRPRKIDHLLDPDPEADALVDQADQEFNALSPEDKAQINADIDALLDEAYNSRPEMDNMSPVQVGDDAYDRFEDINDYSDPVVRDRMNARRMIDMLMPIANDLVRLQKIAQEITEMTVEGPIAQKASEALQRLIQNNQTLEFVNSYRGKKWADVYQLLGDLGVTSAAIEGQIADLIYSILTQQNQQQVQVQQNQLQQQQNVAVAQTDVTTQKQLDNATGKSLIQRHEGNPAKDKPGSGYLDNFGDEIEDKSAKKKSKQPSMIQPFRR